MVEFWHVQDVRHYIQNNMFSIAQSLRCKCGDFQGEQGDRQCRAQFGILWELQLGSLDLNKAPTQAAWRIVMLIITIFLGECTMCHYDCSALEGPGAKLWAKKTPVSNMQNKRPLQTAGGAKERRGRLRQYALLFRVNPCQKLPYLCCHHSQKSRLQCYVGLISDPVLPRITYFSRSIFRGMLRRAPGHVRYG